MATSERGERPELPERAAAIPNAAWSPVGLNRLLVALHGYGDPPSTLHDVLAALTSPSGAAIVAPTGPTTTPAGPAWFPSGPTDEGPSLSRALDSLRSQTLATCLADGYGDDDVVVVGWSQGAAAALAMAARADTDWRPRIVVGLAAWLPNEPDMAWDFGAAAADGMRVLLVHGTDDEVVPIAQGRGAQRVLDRHGVDVTWAEVATGHDLAVLARAAEGWLTDALA